MKSLVDCGPSLKSQLAHEEQSLHSRYRREELFRRIKTRNIAEVRHRRRTFCGHIERRLLSVAGDRKRERPVPDSGRP